MINYSPTTILRPPTRFPKQIPEIFRYVGVKTRRIPGWLAHQKEQEKQGTSILCGLLFVWTAIACALPAQARDRNATDGMHQAQKEAGTLKKFLDDKQLQNKFWLECVRAVGREKCPEAGFRQIIEKLRQFYEFDPKNAEEFFAKGKIPAGGDFHVDIAATGRELQVDTDAWAKQLTELQEKTKKEAASVLRLPIEEQKDIAKDALLIVQQWASEGIVEDEIAKRIRENEDLRAVYNFILHKQLTDEHVLDILASNDPQMGLAIAEQLQEIRKAVNLNHTGALNVEAPSSVRFINEFIPPESELERNKNLFKSVKRTAKRIHFRARSPFVAMFQFMWIDECIGGRCDDRFLRWLTVRRILQTMYSTGHLVEVDGQITGSSHLVPVTYGEGKKGLVLDSLSPSFKEEVTTELPGQGKLTTSLQEVYVTGLPKIMGSEYQPIIYGDAEAVNNAGTRNTVFNMASNLWGEQVADRQSVTILDDGFNETLLELAKQSDQENKYPGIPNNATMSKKLILADLSLVGDETPSAEKVLTLWHTDGFDRARIFRNGLQPVWQLLNKNDPEGFRAAINWMQPAMEEKQVESIARIMTGKPMQADDFIEILPLHHPFFEPIIISRMKPNAIKVDIDSALGKAILEKLADSGFNDRKSIEILLNKIGPSWLGKKPSFEDLISKSLEIKGTPAFNFFIEKHFDRLKMNAVTLKDRTELVKHFGANGYKQDAAPALKKLLSLFESDEQLLHLVTLPDKDVQNAFFHTEKTREQLVALIERLMLSDPKEESTIKFLKAFNSMVMTLIDEVNYSNAISSQSQTITKILLENFPGREERLRIFKALGAEHPFYFGYFTDLAHIKMRELVETPEDLQTIINAVYKVTGANERKLHLYSDFIQRPGFASSLISELRENESLRQSFEKEIFNNDLANRMHKELKLDDLIALSGIYPDRSNAGNAFRHWAINIIDQHPENLDSAFYKKLKDAHLPANDSLLRYVKRISSFTYKTKQACERFFGKAGLKVNLTD